MATRSIPRTATVLLCVIVAAPNAFNQPASKRPRGSRQARLEVSLVVLNVAQVPQDTLDQAEKETADIFRRFGVDVVWSYPKKESTTADSAPGRVRGPICYLRILWSPELFAASVHERRRAGFSYSGGNLIHVFYQRVREEAEVGNLPEYLVLGIIVAHELGHVFLPPGYHSPPGLMSACLNRRMWCEALSRTLTFSDKEKACIRQYLLRAYAATVP